MALATVEELLWASAWLEDENRTRTLSTSSSAEHVRGLDRDFAPVPGIYVKMAAQSVLIAETIAGMKKAIRRGDSCKPLDVDSTYNKKPSSPICSF